MLPTYLKKLRRRKQILCEQVETSEGSNHYRKVEAGIVLPSINQLNRWLDNLDATGEEKSWAHRLLFIAYDYYTHDMLEMSSHDRLRFVTLCNMCKYTIPQELRDYIDAYIDNSELPLENGSYYLKGKGAGRRVLKYDPTTDEITEYVDGQQQSEG